jgi:phosphoribosylformimino-5-aminoimidazole carboxamide ribotide isomerase
MEVIPAVDIRGGLCVRLSQGDYSRETVFDDDPIAVAVRWASLGARRIHIVDLDGAREGEQVNAALLRRIVQTVDAAVQTGGGIRDMKTLSTALDDGVSRVILGTAAVRDPDFLREAVAIARDRLVVSVDSRDGIVQLQGWTEGSDLEAAPFVRQLAATGVERVVLTDIERDGVRGGPNFELYERLVADTSLAVIAAGGVSTLEDLRRLSECGVEAAIVGRALYTGEITLTDALLVA